MRRRIIVFSFILALAITAALAISSTPLTAMFLPNLSATGYGVSDDGNAFYSQGVQLVSCYFGVNGNDLDLITYSSGRKLNFKFNPASAAWQSSGLPAVTNAEVDFFGVNFYGPYRTQGVGTTAQVQASLQYKVSGRTYELFYQSLASKRISAGTWLITSDPIDIGGDPGFNASDQAALGVFRKKTKATFGAVNMPIRFQVTLK